MAIDAERKTGRALTARELQPNFVMMQQLGETAMKLQHEADEIFIVLESWGSLEAPPEYHFLVEASDVESVLELEVQDPESTVPRYRPVIPGGDKYRTIVKKSRNDRDLFIGFEVKADSRTNKIWVYGPDRNSRVNYSLHEHLEFTGIHIFD